MFKCTDCGCEYEIKPEYCDCGNNIFEEIITNTKSNAEPKQIEHTKQVIQKAVSNNPFDFIGWSVFLLCIILSVLSILFLGNSSLTNNEPSTTNETVTQSIKNIPAIDTFWKTSQIEQPINKIEIPSPIQTTVNNIVSVKPKQTQKVTPKQQPVQTTAKQQSVLKNTPVKIDVQKYIPKNNTNTTVTKQTNQSTQIQSQPVKQQVQQPVQQPIIDKTAQQKELASYKIALRNRIAKKIDFTKVIGDGNCAVSFKLNSSGQLIDRKFIQQSSNTSLNDVVYSAMMQNPAYQTPPAGYKNETLTLSVKIYSGQFEVDLK